MHRRIAVIGAAACCIGFAAGAQATVINLDYSGPVDHQVDLTAGTYEITPLGIADSALYDAVNFWGFVSGCDSSGENCANGWRWTYSLGDAPGGGGSVVSSYSSTTTYADALDALAAAKAAGPFQFTLAASQSLYFRFVDSNYSDNLGGASFDLSSVIRTVPEPGTLALLGFGLIGFAVGRRRKAHSPAGGRFELREHLVRRGFLQECANDNAERDCCESHPQDVGQTEFFTNSAGHRISISRTSLQLIARSNPARFVMFRPHLP